MKNTFHVSEEVRRTIKRIQEIHYKRTRTWLAQDVVIAIALKYMEKTEDELK